MKHFGSSKRLWRFGSLLTMLLLLAACGGPTLRVDDSSGTKVRKPSVVQKRGGAYYKDDGPGDDIPSNLNEIPDAVPRAEALHRYANRPYVVLGKSYTPETSVHRFKQRGVASWYGKKFHGQKTSIGETYDMFAMTAAHPTLALPSYVRVSNPANGRSAVVRVTDRGPFHADRIIDLSYAAAYRLGYVDNGSTLVEVEAMLPGDAPPSPEPAKPPPAINDAPDEIEALAVALSSSNVQAASLEKGLFIQLGAFASADNAQSLRARLLRELDWLNEEIQIYAQTGLFRVHLGPYAQRAEAEKVASKIQQALGYRPSLITR